MIGEASSGSWKLAAEFGGKSWQVNLWVRCLAAAYDYHTLARARGYYVVVLCLNVTCVSWLSCGGSRLVKFLFLS